METLCTLETSEHSVTVVTDPPGLNLSVYVGDRLHRHVIPWVNFGYTWQGSSQPERALPWSRAQWGREHMRLIEHLVDRGILSGPILPQHIVAGQLHMFGAE